MRTSIAAHGGMDSPGISDGFKPTEHNTNYGKKDSSLVK
jgi:hypothetical protein